MKKKIVWVAMSLMALFMASCQEDDYLNVIPKNVIALAAVDAAAMDEGNDFAAQWKDSGIDLASKIYLFELPDGTFGLSARLDDEGKMEEWIAQQSEKGDFEPVVKRKDACFSFYKNAWVMGFQGHRLVVLGPVVPSQQAQVQLKISGMLRQDKEQGVKASRMMTALDSLGGPVALVAQVSALPEKLTAPFTLGAPKDCDPAQLWLSATAQARDGIVKISGETFSYNKHINGELKSASQVFRPMTGRYVGNVSQPVVFSILTNVQGDQFLPLLKGSKSIQALLAGMSMKMDVDKVLAAVDGDLCLGVTAFSEEKVRMGLGAQLGNTGFKGQMAEWQKDAQRGFHFALKDGGVGEKAEFFCSNDEALPSFPSISDNASPLRQQLAGERLCLVMNLEGQDNDYLQMARDMLKPLFGDVTAIVYALK